MTDTNAVWNQLTKLHRVIDEARAATLALAPRLPSRIRKFGPAFEIKRTTATSTKICGYGSVFDVRDSHNEVVERGAFSKSIAWHKKTGTRPLMLWQHNATSPIGVWEVFVEDDTGLWLEGRLLPRVRLAEEAMTLIEAGAISGLSIGYRVIRDRNDQFSSVRHLLELDLVEVSIVSLPANVQARIATGKEYTAREMKRALESLRRFSFPSIN